ncbi:MAG: hypothetical protein QXT63_00090 [Thermoplasmata archaeon]
MDSVESSQKARGKTLEAENVALLKHLLEIELRRLKEEAELDMIFFVGVDGRIFASYIPEVLDASQFGLLSLWKAQLPHMCAQLRNENMKVSIQQFKHGTVIITGVGDNAFLVSLISRDVEVTNLLECMKRVLMGSLVIKHIFELKPLSESTLSKYPKEVSEELAKLSRLLFKERFVHTKEYIRNMEVLEFIKKKLSNVVGLGNVDEICTVTFNELGTSPKYMTAQLWMVFAERIIKEHVKRAAGEVMADECMRTWIPEIEKKLKSFV